MRKVLTVIFTLLYFSGFSQHIIGWMAPAPVASKVYGNLHPRIKMDKNNNPMVVWGDEGGKVYLSKWGGESFSAPITINNAGTTAFATSWAGPDIATRGDTIYIVYKQVPEETSPIYLKHSYDGGKTFSIATEVDVPGRYITRFPTVTADENGNPFVSFMKSEKDYDGSKYVVARSEDMGESFLKDTFASLMSGGRVCECTPASLVVSGNAGILLYRNNQNRLRNIWAGVSNNGCVSFNNGLRMDSTEYYPETCPASSPSGVIVGDTLYAVYMSGVADSALIYMSKLSLSVPSLSTAAVTGVVPGIVMQNFPRISGTANAAAVAWTQTAGGNNQVCLSLTGDLTNGFPPAYDTIAEGVMINADVAIGGSYVYVVWEDQITRSVMFRRGRYSRTKVAIENTSVLVTPPAPGQKYFFVNMPDILSCGVIDKNGTETEADISYPKNPNICKVSMEDMDPGKYTIKVSDVNGRTFTAQVEMKAK